MTSPVVRCGLLIAFLAIAPFSLCGCSPPQITYEQVGACTATKSGAWVYFKIHGIDNSANSTDLDFNPRRMVVPDGIGDGYDSPLNGFTTGSLCGYGNPYPPEAQSRKVPAGTRFDTATCGRVLINTSDQDGAREANQTSYFLNYKPPEGTTGVLLTKLNSSRTSWPYTPRCEDIRFP
jgi:hypothetical protein